jgi:heme-degrading monooxygenase HmoA
VAFTVVNSVRGTPAEIPAVIVEVQRLGIDVLQRQPGFRHARLMVAEDLTEAVLYIEWDSREHFVAYRQGEAGRRLVESAMRLHPQISFFDVISSFDA